MIHLVKFREIDNFLRKWSYKANNGDEIRLKNSLKKFRKEVGEQKTIEKNRKNCMLKSNNVQFYRKQMVHMAQLKDRACQIYKEDPKTCCLLKKKQQNNPKTKKQKNPTTKNHITHNDKSGLK